MKIGTFMGIAILAFCGIIGLAMYGTHVACYPLWPTCPKDPANGIILLGGVAELIAMCFLSNKIKI